MWTDGPTRRDLADFAVRYVVAVVVDDAQPHLVDAAADGAVHLQRIVGEARERVVAGLEHAVELDELGAAAPPPGTP